MAVPEVWSDLHQDLVTDSRGSLKKVINVDSVRTSINNILGTAQGERVMLPEFASNLRDMLFEPLDEELMHLAATEVKRAVERWDDRVSVIGVDFNQDPDNNQISMSMKFTIKGYPDTFTYTREVG